jgi:hypothetical protein
MNRKSIVRVSCVLAVGLLAGCATPLPTGICYTNVKLPVAATGAATTHTKTGVAKCHTLFGLIARGDASIDTAAKNGNIKTIDHVDFSVRNVLGIAGEYTTTVYGD